MTLISSTPILSAKTLPNFSSSLISWFTGALLGPFVKPHSPGSLEGVEINPLYLSVYRLDSILVDESLEFLLLDLINGFIEDSFRMDTHLLQV